MIPGSNILQMALSVIARQAMSYFRFSGRTTNDIGLDVASYFPVAEVTGSFQAVSLSMYSYMGLDLQKRYFNIFIENDIIDVTRDVSGDQFEVGGIRLQALSNTPWYGIDGWTQVLCVQIPMPENPVSPNQFFLQNGDSFAFENGSNFNFIG